MLSEVNESMSSSLGYNYSNAKTIMRYGYAQYGHISPFQKLLLLSPPLPIYKQLFNTQPKVEKLWSSYIMSSDLPPSQNTNSKKRSHSQSQTQSQTQPKSASQKESHPKLKGLTHKTITISTPSYTYISLTLTSSLPPRTTNTSSQTPQLDALTARTHLTSALTQFLGLSGSAISIDILKIEERQVWVRVPREDAGAFVAAVGGWIGNGAGREEKVGWRVGGRSNWLSGLGNEGSVWDD